MVEYLSTNKVLMLLNTLFISYTIDLHVYLNTVYWLNVNGKHVHMHYTVDNLIVSVRDSNILTS